MYKSHCAVKGNEVKSESKFISVDARTERSLILVLRTDSCSAIFLHNVLSTRLLFLRALPALCQAQLYGVCSRHAWQRGAETLLSISGNSAASGPRGAARRVRGYPHRIPLGRAMGLLGTGALARSAVSHQTCFRHECFADKRKPSSPRNGASPGAARLLGRVRGGIAAAGAELSGCPRGHPARLCPGARRSSGPLPHQPPRHRLRLLQPARCTRTSTLTGSTGRTRRTPAAGPGEGGSVPAAAPRGRCRGGSAGGSVKALPPAPPAAPLRSVPPLPATAAEPLGSRTPLHMGLVLPRGQRCRPSASC